MEISEYYCKNYPLHVKRQTDDVCREFLTSVDKSTSNKFGCIDCGRRNAVAVTPDETQMRK